MTSGAPQNPFPGLRPFKPEESTLFFGRDEQIGEALDRLMRQKLLAVVGVSGCGKSSLVTAGMVPTLEMGLAGDPNQQWRVEIMRPGDGPFREVQRCLGFGSAPLVQRTYGLREAVKANLPADQNLLLVVDQFEEIFPYRDRLREGGGNEADLFVSYLLSAVQEPAARVYIILTMRSDYMGECAKFHGLPEALNDGQYLVPRMTRAQLQEAIERPLEAIVGADGQAVQFHAGLVQKLLNGCDEEPDNLPLLQHLLRRLFEEWVSQGARGQITPKMAESVGELSDALNRDAETVFKALSLEQQRIAEVIFRRITESRRQAGGSKDDRPVRRPQTVVHLAELAQTSEVALRDVVRRFEERGLLVVRTTDELDKVDLPHECLCLKWNRLKEWIEKEAQDAKALRFLADAVGQSRLTGSALTEAVAWKKSGRLKGAWGQRYLGTEDVHRVEAWVLHSKRRVDIQVTLALIMLALVLGFGVVSTFFWHRARVALATAQAGELAATADSLSKDFPDLSLLLALEARQLAPEPTPTADGLLRAAAAAYPYRAVLRGHEGSVLAAQFSADGKKVLTSGYDETARVWDVSSARQVCVLRAPPRLSGTEIFAQFSPDGKTVLTEHGDETARLWDASTCEQIRTLINESPISRARFSADGKMVLIALADRTARLWDVATGKELRALSGHAGALLSVQFSADGKTVLTASDDGTARLWNTVTGKQQRVLPGEEDSLVGAEFSADSRTVLTTSHDGMARLWSAATGKALRVLTGHEGAISTAHFSADGRQVLTAGDDRTVRLWDVATGEVLQVLRHDLFVNSAEFSADGTTVLTASDDKTARLWDAETGKEMRVLRGHDDSVRTAQFSPDGNTLLTGSYDTTARLWDVATGPEPQILRGHVGHLLSAQFSADSKMVLTAADDRTARLWDAATGKELRLLRGHEGAVHRAQFSNDGTTVVTVSDDKTVRLWDVATGKELQVLRGHEGPVYKAQISGDGKTVLTADSQSARLWDVASGKELRVFGNENKLRFTEFSVDGKKLLTVRNDLDVRLWDADSGNALTVLTGHEQPATSARFSPDGKTVLTASEYDRTARLWDADSGNELRVLRHEGLVVLAEFSVDGKIALTASHDGTARLWDVASGRELRVMRGHENQILSAQFSADGRTVLTTSDDGTARLWGAASGKELRVLRRHESPVRAHLSADAKLVVTVTFAEDTVLLWTCSECRPIEELVQEVAKRIRRELTDDERSRFGLQARGSSEAE